MHETSSEARWPLLDALDRPRGFAEYVEEQMVGPDLLGLIRDLEAAQSGPAPGCDPPADLVARVREVGLAGLTDAEAALVFANPGWLLPLQKSVLTGGSTHWDGVISRVD